MVEFPHLGESSGSFPGNNGRPFGQYRNSFDYDRYTGETLIKPCSVKWSLESTDRPYWESKEARDQFFDALAGDAYSLTTIIDITPESSVKLPIPFNALQSMNYLAVTMPELPGSGGPLPYETEGPKRFYYFIESAHYLAPNTTECRLVLDAWTTWIYDLEIPRIWLERGHYPLKQTSVTSYLSNPVENNAGLLAPEPGAPSGNPSRVTDATWTPIGKGDLYAVFAWKTDPGTLSIPATTGGTDTDASYSDYKNSSGDVTYDGEEYVVEDYDWGQPPNVRTQAVTNSPGYSADNVRPNGFAVTSIAASRLETFLNNLDTSYVPLWNALEAVYILPSDMIQRGSSLTIGGVSHQYVTNPAESTLLDISLTQADFDYPAEYAGLAKLYTSPYAWLTISDGAGAEVIVNIEDTASLKVKRQVNAIYPYLTARTFLEGVGTDTAITYTWKTISGDATTTIPGSGYATALMVHEIPTFILTASSQAAWTADNYSTQIYNARQNAINSYHITARGANTDQYNTQQANATALANTQRTNSAATTNTARQNTANSSLTSLANQTTNNSTSLTTSYNSEITTLNNNKLQFDVQTDNLMISASTIVQNETLTATNNINSISNIATSVIGGAVTGAMGGALVGGVGALPGALVGAVAGLMSSGATAIQSGITTSISMGANEDIASAQQANNRQKLNETVLYNRNSTNQNNELLTSQASLQTNQNSQATSINNSLATDLNATSVNASNTNATNSANVSNANASRSRHHGVLSGQTLLTQAQREYQAKWQDLARSKPTIISNGTGDATLDQWGSRGLLVQVATQPEDVTKRQGDMMLTYGYTTTEMVESPSLNLMDQFTYWQGDATVTGSAPTTAITTVRDLFATGITVWRNPDKIGSSIYENGI